MATAENRELVNREGCEAHVLLQRPGCSNISVKWAILRRLEGLVVEGVVARWLQKQPPGPRPRVGEGGGR